MSETTTAKNIPINIYLLVIFSIICSEFLIMGISLGTLPAYVHETLSYNNVMVGVVIGLQYVATLLTRHLAGKSADTKGGKVTVTTGLILSAVSGIFCLLSLWLQSYAPASLGLLCLARILLGIGESYLVIGIFAWGFLLVGPRNTGKVMVWNGLGMHAGMALGAPLGIILQSHFGLFTSFTATMILPVFSMLIANFLPDVSLPQVEKRLPFYKAIKLV